MEEEGEIVKDAWMRRRGTVKMKKRRRRGNEEEEQGQEQEERGEGSENVIVREKNGEN